MTVTVRPIRREDAESIIGMAHEFGAYLQSLGDHWEPKFTPEKYLADGFGPNPAFGGFIGEEAGQPLGYLLHSSNYDVDLACRSLMVIDLWVRPWTRRLGLGRKLMEAAADHARQTGAGYLFWSVFKPNTIARRFYDGIGATAVTDLDFMTLKP
ncbi:MAG TPA: GNAT family N-acetyltransferase [Candidatus Cybelea sp.]|nr:GNAT family N-acetyltransferase [Candidatus Cybelea sp.]